MDEHAWEENRSAEMRIGRWLFNPFYYVAGGNALIVGLLVLALTGLLAFFGKVRFDGLLDFHMGVPAVPLWVHISENLLSWLLLGILLFLAGKIISNSRPRFIDVVGTQALARTPYLFVSLSALMPGTRRFALELVAGHPAQGRISADMAVFCLVVVFSLVMLVWMVALMYRAFAVSCNVSGKIAVAIFTVALIVGEIISKFLVLGVIPNLIGR